MPTRRAFLMAGAAFAGGSVVGAACGYSAGVAARTGGAAEVGGEAFQTGDAELNELRRLAVQAPIEELVAKWDPWATAFNHSYQNDLVLWKGMDRLAVWAVANPTSAELPLLLALIGAANQDSRGTSLLLDAREGLRRVRASRRR